MSKFKLDHDLVGGKRSITIGIQTRRNQRRAEERRRKLAEKKDNRVFGRFLKG